jgi:hypothetical protein
MSEYTRKRTRNLMIGPYLYAHVESADALDDLRALTDSAASRTLAVLPQRPEGTYPGETGPLVPEPDDGDWEPAEGDSWIVDPYQN